MAAQGADDDDAWLIDMQNDIKKDFASLEPIRTGYTICRVPDRFWIDKKNAYSPLTISIGPLHHGKENLKPMEKSKLAYMVSLFERTRDETEILNICLHATSALDKIVRDCYKEEVEYTTPELVRMLFLDGCYILELFIRCHMNDFRDGDLFFVNPYLNIGVRRDLVLLENQIPFIVLDRLFQVIKDNSNSDHINLPNLVDLARCFFELGRPTNEGREFFHLLDLIHCCYSPSSPSEHPGPNRTWKRIHSVTELKEAGVKFAVIEHENDKKKSLENGQKKSLFDLEFKDGVIKMPRWRVESSVLFQNLIAMEQCLTIHGYYMTSYVLLMNYLLDTSKDVEFLVTKKIIPRNFADYEQVADLFNNICEEVVVRDFYFGGLCNQVADYCKSKRQACCCVRRLSCSTMRTSG